MKISRGDKEQTMRRRMWEYTSDPFPSLRGLRQGCPFSPVLFDIFDNDWLGKPGKPRYGCGVVVLGIPKDEEGQMAGLLFADDLEGNGNSLEGMHYLAQVVSKKKIKNKRSKLVYAPNLPGYTNKLRHWPEARLLHDIHRVQ